MPANNGHATRIADQLRGAADLPLIIEHLLDQLDELRTSSASQQAQLNRQAARIDTLERR